MRLWCLILITGLAAACEETSTSEHEPLHTDDDSDDASSITLTPEQIALGCLPMGEGESAHVMCNHGHSLSLRSENLYARWLYLNSQGMDPISEADLMMTASEPDSMLPDPLTPVLRASVGERVKIRAVSYGPEIHDFHVHGHVWAEGERFIDTQDLAPAEVYDGAEFYAGAGAEDATPRGGAGDWMYHCHVETHATSGMWGVFRVSESGDTTGVGDNGRYDTELPAPIGGEGETIDVWVVAAEVPLVVAREFNTAMKTLDPVERMARLYIPVADETTFNQATSSSLQQEIREQAETWMPWVLVLRIGTTVRVHLRNVMSSAPVSMHPHGVRYDIDNDGTHPEDVAWPDGSEIVYEWTADTAGTWPMHDHASTLVNLGRGLFSAIVVKTPEEEERLDRDYLVIFHDYDMNWMMGMPDDATPSTHGH